MKFVIDMNLGPEWIACLATGGWESVHWLSVGPSDASDDDIVRWAGENDRIVLTADLDFGNGLIRSGNKGPSVVQLRTRDILVRLVGTRVMTAITQTRSDLAAGALVTVEHERYRVRRLSHV